MFRSVKVCLEIRLITIRINLNYRAYSGSFSNARQSSSPGKVSHSKLRPAHNLNRLLRDQLILKRVLAQMSYWGYHSIMVYGTNFMVHLVLQVVWEKVSSHPARALHPNGPMCSMSLQKEPVDTTCQASRPEVRMGLLCLHYGSLSCAGTR